MPISFTEEIKLTTLELSKLVKYCIEIGLPRHHLIKLAPKLNKLELMILDSAFKDLDLVKLRNTILILEEPYLKLLQNTTRSLLSAIQDFILKQ